MEKEDRVLIDNISFKYRENEKLIIENLSIDVNRGDFVCLLGQSGCGKSTLLRLLSGLEKPTLGEIYIFGKKVKSAGLDKAVVFQNYGLFPWMKAGENIVLALRQRYPDKSKSECQKMTKEVLEKVGLQSDVYDKYPKELSGGMQQRCAIARAFVIDAPVLLMDEPFGALDAVTRAKLQNLVVELWEKDENKKTVFFVTHDVDEAIILGNKIFVMGQSPSNIIYNCEISFNHGVDRSVVYKNDEMIKTRNNLIAYINEDVKKYI